MEMIITFLGVSSQILENELVISRLAQVMLSPVEPLWFFLSEYFTPGHLLDIFVPLVGILDYQLLVRLVCSLGFVNMASSLIKWTTPEHRPYWWARENTKLLVPIKIEQFPLTCETSAGFPSSHTMAFTAFCYLSSRAFIKCYYRHTPNNEQKVNERSFLLVSLMAVLMLTSRIYLGTQFLHQSLVSVFVSLYFMSLLRRFQHILLDFGKLVTVGLTLYAALLPVLVFFYRNSVDSDPHWSVRMAFKWCIDPTYLKHEAAPIFILIRDVGYLMGISLCTPLEDTYSVESSFKRRLPTILVMEFFNNWARLATPKDYGRAAFLGWEFSRNCLHSFALLYLVAKISKVNPSDKKLKQN